MDNSAQKKANMFEDLAKPKPPPGKISLICDFVAELYKKGWKVDHVKGKTDAMTPVSHTRYNKSNGKVTDQMGPPPKLSDLP